MKERQISSVINSGYYVLLIMVDLCFTVCSNIALTSNGGIVILGLFVVKIFILGLISIIISFFFKRLFPPLSSDKFKHRFLAYFCVFVFFYIGINISYHLIQGNNQGFFMSVRDLHSADLFIPIILPTTLSHLLIAILHEGKLLNS